MSCLRSEWMALLVQETFWCTEAHSSGNSTGKVSFSATALEDKYFTYHKNRLRYMKQSSVSPATKKIFYFSEFTYLHTAHAFPKTI